MSKTTRGLYLLCFSMRSFPLCRLFAVPIHRPCDQRGCRHRSLYHLSQLFFQAGATASRNADSRGEMHPCCCILMESLGPLDGDRSLASLQCCAAQNLFRHRHPLHRGNARVRRHLHSGHSHVCTCSYLVSQPEPQEAGTQVRHGSSAANR